MHHINVNQKLVNISAKGDARIYYLLHHLYVKKYLDVLYHLKVMQRKRDGCNHLNVMQLRSKKVFYTWKFLILSGDY